MKKRLKITEGKAYILPVIKGEGVNISIKSHILIGVGVEDSTNKDGNYLTAIIGNGKIPVVKANAELIADAFNTANETQLLPSELKEQRDELIRVLQDFISSAEVIDDEHFSMEIDQAKELINKID